MIKEFETYALGVLIRYNGLVDQVFKELKGSSRAKDREAQRIHSERLIALLGDESVKLRFPGSLYIPKEDVGIFANVDIPIYLSPNLTNEVAQGYILKENGVAVIRIPPKYQGIFNEKLEQKGFKPELRYSHELSSFRGAQVFRNPKDRTNLIARVESWIGKEKLVRAQIKSEEAEKLKKSMDDAFANFHNLELALA